MGWSWVVLLLLSGLVACDAPVTSIEAPNAGTSTVPQPAADAGDPDSTSTTDADLGERMDGSTPPLDASIPTTDASLTIRALTRTYDLAGEHHAPIDAREWRASVLWRGVETGTAAGDADGFIRGLPAPDGERMVIVRRRDSAVTYDVVVVVGTSTTIEMLDAVARRDTPVAPRSTGLTIDVRGLAPWDERDRVLLFTGTAPDVAIDLGLHPLWFRCISGGDTRISACALDWTHRALLRGRPQDVLFVGRAVAFAHDDLTGHRLAELARADLVSLAPGTNTTVTATATPLSSSPLTLSFGDQRELDEDREVPGLSPFTASASVELRAHGGHHALRWWPLPAVQLLHVEWPAGAGRAIEAQVPPPIDGFETHVVYQRTAWRDHAPARARRTRVSSGITLPLLHAQIMRVRLPMSGPRDVRINAVPVTDVARNGTLFPAIDWQPPAFGRPDGYRITLNAFDPLGQPTRIQIFTRQTSVELPRGLIPLGTREYEVTVTALHGFDVTRRPFDTPKIEAWADAAMAIVTP